MTEKITQTQKDRVLIIEAFYKDGRVRYNKNINFPDAAVASLIVLDLEKYINDIKSLILTSTRQQHETVGGHSENYIQS